MVFLWKKTELPEDTKSIIRKSFGCEYARLLVSGSYQNDNSPIVAIANRMRRFKTGCDSLDSSMALGVPLDGKWHWQTGFARIFSWSFLPEFNDEGWIPVSENLPENTEPIFSFGNMKAISVLALHEMYPGIKSVSILNRVKIEPYGVSSIEELGTNGWEWSKRAGTVLAWMPVPEPEQEN